MASRPRTLAIPTRTVSLDRCLCLALVVAILAVYAQTAGFTFTNYDDDAYVPLNANVRDGLTWAGLAWAFTSVKYFYWQPLTWLSHMLDCSLFGLNAGAHHLVNVALHAANGVLLWLVLRRLTGESRRSLLVAALFALHPLRVESVAWIAERKDLLSGLCWILLLWAYARHAERPSPRRFAWVAATMAAGLLCKPTLVTAPFALLLLDRWPLRRTEPWRQLILEKLPLLPLSVASSIITALGQDRMGATRMLLGLTPELRLQNALVSYVKYLGNLFWPHPLAVLYPFPREIGWPTALAAALLLAVITALAVWQVRRRPWLLVGWLWFVGILVPNIGLLQVGMQARADRFTYVPSIFLLVALVWLAAEATRRWPARAWAAGAVCGALAVVSWAQVSTWRDSVSLMGHARTVAPGNFLAHLNLGTALAERGRPAEALVEFQAAMVIDAEHPNVRYNLARALYDLNHRDEAVPHFAAAVRLKPDYADAHYSLALLQLGQGKSAEAAGHFRESLRLGLRADYVADARNNLGVILAQQGRMADAEREFAAALQDRPDLIAAHKNLVLALVAQNRTPEAVQHLTRALPKLANNAELQSLLTHLSTK